MALNRSSAKKTGQDVTTEELLTPVGARAATFSIIYLLLMVLVFAWLMFDTWVGQHSIARLFGYNLTRLDTPEYRLIVYTVIGGVLGGVVNGIRSVILNFRKFDPIYTWKYITAPVTGGILGFFVYALSQTGISILGGNTPTNAITTAQALANFGIGALAGYGSKDVLIWLDFQVSKLFHVPDTKGIPQTPEEEKIAEAAAAAKGEDLPEMPGDGSKETQGVMTIAGEPTVPLAEAKPAELPANDSGASEVVPAEGENNLPAN